MDSNKKKTEKKALLRSAAAPAAPSRERLERFIAGKYGDDVKLVWEEDPQLADGFLLQVGTDIYDWTLEGRLRQFKRQLDQLHPRRDAIIPLVKEAVENWVPEATPEEVGQVVAVGDEIATVSGLKNASYGEILQFSSGVKGMVQELKRDEIGCVLFGDDEEIVEGSIVHRTGKTAGVPVGEAFLGRVVNALGEPIDGKGEIQASEYRPIEAPAPDIIHRQPVDTPMETGLLAIDTMFPIGRGQRELIIGDRQTGKTAIALDTILNQKGKDVVCIYVAIGQKASSVAELVETLEKFDALSYSIVVSASASDAATMQYIAPYAGCAIGEYFMYQGKDVLIVYDDLTKHAIAYRALSLLLERSARLSEEMGGGSMTALPIVETQAGDVSAYIPTNIISITDGQIFLEEDLFFSGQRPAVNVGLSVSRVGGDAQTKAMKTAAGAIRLDLAQYREMEVFTQFSSDLDDLTRRQLAYGQGLMRLLRQPQYHPMKQHEQVILLVVALHHTLQDLKVQEVDQFRRDFLAHMEEKAADLCRRIDRSGKLSQEDQDQILQMAKDFLSAGQEAASGKDNG